jgi:predicted nucleic acid-binding protein
MAIHRSLGHSVLRLVTWGVIAETYTWLRYHQGYRIAERWLTGSEQFVAEGRLEVLYPAEFMGPGIHRPLRRFEDQDLSYVDALSIALIQSRGDIDAVFAFDPRLGLAGVPVLP